MRNIVTEITARLMREAQFDQERAQAYTWWLLEFITSKRKAELLINTTEFSETDMQKIQECLDRIILHHEPLAYIIGHVFFNNVMINVKPPILIPRPETEEWVYRLTQQIKIIFSGTQHLTILDMCTGSGCIAISLAHDIPQATIYAADMDPLAIELTHKNAQANKVTVHAIKTDLFDAIPENMFFDIIVANPPYISHTQRKLIEPSVRDWESELALFANDDGLACIAEIIKKAPRFLKKNLFSDRQTPNLVIEIGHTQGPRVKTLMEAAGFVKVHIEQDLTGKDRVVVGTLP